MQSTEQSSSSTSSAAKIYRLLGVLAVLHAAAVAGSLSFSGWFADQQLDRLWIALGTAWVIWPFILGFHPGASRLRAYVAAGAAAPFIAFWFPLYADAAPRVFGLPDGIQLTPHVGAYWVVAYVAGRTEGERHSNNDVLRLEGYGMAGTYTPPAPQFSPAAREKYRIEIDPVASCVVDTWIIGHAYGYNQATLAAIERRYGRQVITTARQEELGEQAQWAAAEEAGKARAKIDAAAGAPVVVIHGARVEGEEEYEQLLRDSWGIQLRRMSAQEAPEELTHAYVSGYQEVLWQLIEDRHGSDANSVVFAIQGGEPFERFRARTRKTK
jgi:hypothetical protein